MENFYEIKEFLLTKKKFLLVGLISVILFGLIFFLWFSGKNGEELEDIVINEEVNNDDDVIKDDTTVECIVTVDIKGEVVNPGLYKVECDKRIQDVIDISGGVTSNADTSVLNLSKKVFDEMVIIVYSKKEVTNFIEVKQEEVKKEQECQNQSEVKNDACIESVNKSTTTTDITITEEKTSQSITSQNSININEASKEELTKLSGIGDSKALKIIEYRNSNGPFKTIDEIKNVKGIGNSIFEKIKDYITV